MSDTTGKWASREIGAIAFFGRPLDAEHAAGLAFAAAEQAFQLALGESGRLACAEYQVSAVRELHASDGQWCTDCSQEWPCRTVRAIDGVA